jgi:hypothetical protein
MFHKLCSWYNKLFTKEKFYKYKYVEDVPDELKPDILYIISNDNFYWQVAMLCPCGCKKNLHLNLIKGNHPKWRFEIDKKKRISLHPSINRTVGCKSHFWVRKGKIIWA